MSLSAPGRVTTPPGLARPDSRAWVGSRRQAAGTLVALIGAILSGCAYRLGPTSGVPAGSRSIAVAPFENETLEPRVSEAITTALRSQLQQEGTYRLARQRDADVVVHGVVRGISRQEESFQSRDVRVLRDYRFNIVVQVTAVERGTGRTLLDRSVEGHTMLRVLEDLGSAERQAMPLLAGNLARNITSLLVDGDW